MVLLTALTGCNFSPLSPSNRNNIRNNGEIGDIKNNQQGIMAEVMNLKNRLEVMAQEIETLQNGLINYNNKNSGVQILQGDGGLIVALSALALIAIVAMNYKIKCEKYKKTAEIFGEKIKSMNRPDLEEDIMLGAMAKKVESEAFGILKK